MLHRLFPLTLLLFAAAGLVTADPPSRVAIRDARVYTVSGPVLEKATVLIKDGLIEAVGENIPIPAGVTVIDGTGLNVYPGLIDALSTWGIAELAAPVPPAGGGRGGAQPAPTTPAPATTATPPPARARGPEDRPNTFTWVKAADLVKPSDRRIETARSAGFTPAAARTAGVVGALSLSCSVRRLGISSGSDSRSLAGHFTLRITGTRAFFKSSAARNAS